MLNFEENFSAWAADRVDAWPGSDEIQIIPINDPKNLLQKELNQLREQCALTNFAIYRVHRPEQVDKETIRCFVASLGMVELDQNLCADQDAVTTLTEMNVGRGSGYIPYTSKALNWHTDGYYNELHQHVRSFLLHCIRNAPNGGENMLINHELVFIKLYQQNPDLVKALMQADALTIPANIENGAKIRADRTGPVFYRDPVSNYLQMRYTARGRNIQWKDDPLVAEAAHAIDQILQGSGQGIVRYTLKPGEGLICNNILHGRTAFSNGNMSGEERVLYRVRSYNRLFSHV